MQANDIKLILNTFFSQSEPGAKAGKGAGLVSLTDVLNALKALKIENIDLLNISRELRPALESALISEFEKRAKDSRPLQVEDIKNFVRKFLKDIHRGGHILNSPAEGLDSPEADVVNISKGLKSAIRTIMSEAGSPRHIEIPQGANGYALLHTLLNEAVPGLRFRVLKAYKRKNWKKKGPFKKKKGDEEGRKDAGQDIFSKGGANGGSDLYQPENIVLKAVGSARAGGKDALGLCLELKMPSVSGFAVNGKTIEISPFTVNHAGTAEGLEEMRFTFEAEGAGGPEGAPFVTTGYGFLTIDLTEVGTSEDGSPVYGVLNEGRDEVWEEVR